VETGISLFKRAFQRSIMSVDIVKEVYLAVPLDDGGSIENPYRHRLLKANAQGLIADHRRTDALIGPIWSAAYL
jgi:hypothetical protein